MSRYGTPFCSDEELLEELNKLGYNDVSPDVFDMMKDDLAEIVEKEQENLTGLDYDVSGHTESSKLFSTLSDSPAEYFTKKSGEKSFKSVSRKVKKKSHNSFSRIAKDIVTNKHELETNIYESTENKHKIKSSHSSLEREDSYNDDRQGLESHKYQNTESRRKIKSSNVSLEREDSYDDRQGLENNKYQSTQNRRKVKGSNVSLDREDSYNDDRQGLETNKYRSTENRRKIKGSSISLEREDSYNDDRQGLKSNKYESTENRRKMKSSNVSLDRENSYNDDDAPDLGFSENVYTSSKGLNSDNYSNYSNMLEVNEIDRNENTEYNNGLESLSLRDDDYQLNYSSNDRLLHNSNVLTPKETEFSNVNENSYDQVYNLSSSGKKLPNNSWKNVKYAFKTLKFGKDFSELDEDPLYNYKGSDLNLNTSQSSTSSETKTIKRKVLRRRNGRSVITEELVEIPSVFDTSYPESESFNNSKSFSSDDLSSKTNSSTGSVAAVSPETSIKSSPSALSLLSTRSTSLRVPNSRKKKSDPVAMYGYYRKFWDNFKPPGENKHDRLRWAVRDKMLDYNI